VQELGSDSGHRPEYALADLTTSLEQARLSASSNVLTKSPQLLTVREAAQVLRIAEWTLRAKVRAGDIPALRLGDGPHAPIRFSAVALDDWLNRERPS
jgi:excisionase family DNA binding protein